MRNNGGCECLYAYFYGASNRKLWKMYKERNKRIPARKCKMEFNKFMTEIKLNAR